MVLNLFLALLLNSFNSEELKSKKEEVGDESKLTKSFERIRSIVRKGRLGRKREDDGTGKLEKLVQEIVIQQRNEKKGILMNPSKRYSQPLPPPIYSESYQESLNRPVSGSNFNYDLNLSDNLHVVKTISGSQETVTDMDEQQQLPDDKRNNGILHQMSSGFGTQQSKDEPLDMSDAVELKALGPIMRKGIPQQLQKRQSCPMPRNFNSQAHAIDTNSNSSSCTYSEISKQLKRLSSNQSINTLSLDQDELLNHINLKDELLNCDKKELFQFLRDDHYVKDNFDNFYNATSPPSVPPASAAAIIDMTDVRKSVHIQENIEMLKSPEKQMKDFEKLPSVNKMSEMGEMNTGKPWHCLVSYVDDLTVGGRKNSQGEYVDPESSLTFGKDTTPKVPADCFPRTFYERCLCLDECIKTKTGQRWTAFRTSVLTIVDTPAFEWIVLVLIFASSVTLCFEDIHLDKNKELKRILYWTNFFFSCIFVIEMFLKWIAHGFTRYFTSFWTILDFIIVFVS